nr:hypothetical protein CFP56_27833 [Quercus suber]
MLDQDSNPVFFDFYMLTGGALGDKQHVSSSDFLLLSYGAYIDVNFVVTDLQIVTSKCHRRYLGSALGNIAVKYHLASSTSSNIHFPIPKVRPL